MSDVSSDVEQMESETPGFKREYKANMHSIATKRLGQISEPRFDQIHEEAKDKAKMNIDRMTELLKVEPLMERLEEVDKEIAQSGEEAVLAFIDVNMMRDLNKKWKHRGGDFALKTIGQTLKKILRQTDVAGRYGGDELVVLLRNMTPEQAKEVVTGRFFPTLIEGVTVSVGLTRYVPGRLQPTLQSADTVMMGVKEKAHQTMQNEVDIIDESQINNRLENVA